MIDERVCEGCGDCGVKSNCLSLQTGRHRVRPQDRHRPGQLQPRRELPQGRLPGLRDRQAGQGRRTGPAPGSACSTGRGTGADPPRPPAAGATLRMPGIGGTGVVTVSQMLGAAAKHRRTGRPTPSTRPASARRPARSCRPRRSATPEPGRVDVLLGFDLLASVTPANLARGSTAAASVVVASTTLTPTGRMVGTPDGRPRPAPRSSPSSTPAAAAGAQPLRRRLAG